MKFIIAGLLSSVALASMASPLTSVVDLGGGTVNKASTLTLSLQQLVPTFAYQITCSITDANSAQNPAWMSANFSGMAPGLPVTMAVNGVQVPNLTAQLTQVTNTVVIYSVISDLNTLNINNGDQSDSFVVNDCKAVITNISKK